MIGRIKGHGRGSSARRPGNIACYSSALVLAALGAGKAQAQCLPNPSQTAQPVSCTGTQTGGYTISSDQSQVTVNTGATILNSGDALTVAISSGPYAFYRSTTVAVQGSIASSGGSGILFTSGPPPAYMDYAGTFGTITVAAGASISGITGITVTPDPSPLSTYAQAAVTLDNSGTITGTTGPALATIGTGNFSSITNEASGSLGAIAASFNSLANNGTIDGGALSAVSNTSPQGYSSISNGGTIRSAGPAATVLLDNTSNFTNAGTISNSGGGQAINTSGTFTNQASGTVTGSGSDVVTGGYLTVSNYGAITNSGSGQAVSANVLTLDNYAGATINGGSGGIAVNGIAGLTLVNAGTINGSVLAGSAASNYAGVSVDSTQGTINGDVTFGSGSNSLVATIVDGAIQTGITGTITGGIGPAVSNTLKLATTGNATLSSSVTLPTNFTLVSFEPGYGATLTLGDGFSSTSTITDNGPGTLVNATTLSGSGQIVSMGYNTGTFSNTGTITAANLGSGAAIGLSGYAVLQNTGTITATGDGITGFGNGVINSGTISAGGTAVSAFLDTGYQNGGFSNSGTISSTAGIAVSLSLSCTCFSASNSGTISGAAIGLQLGDGTFTNTGTITAPGYGVTVNNASTINNLAGGVITGGTAAIGDTTGLPSSIFVTNAGTINGNVNLAGSGYYYYNYYYGANSFDAAPGGVLNGNLTLGSGDTLIADLVNTGSSAFAGIFGTVTANNSNLVYNVSANASVLASAPAGFTSVAYQLFNNATLTMAAGTSSNVTLGLAGVGTVDLNGAIDTTNQSALQSQGPVTSLGYVSPQSTALAITNNGSISAQFTNPSPTSQTAVALNYGGDLVNNGTITGTSITGLNYDDFTTVFAPASLVNIGTIQGTGLAGVSIGNASGYGASAILTNSGTIASDQNAVFAIGAVTITNSGTITSTGANGIYNPQYYGQAQVTNLAGGTISGSTDAILLSGGTVSNAGTIDGNVDLSYSLFAGQSYYPGTYYDNGGTLNGNLTLTSNGALMIDLARQGTGPLGGVTGTITANGGSLIYEVNVSASTSGAPTDAGFGSTGYVLANDPTLTFAAGSQQATTVALAGTGSVILNGTIGTTNEYGVVTQQPALLAATGNTSTSNALAITNNGTITTAADTNWYAPVAVALTGSDTLINAGTIAVTDTALPYYPSGAVSGGLSVTNTGTISGTNVSAVLPGTALTNTGTITSNVNAITLVGVTTITNGGTISSTGAAAISDGSNYFYNFAPVTVTNLATGIITGAPDAIDLFSGAVINAGTINGNVNLASSYGYYGSGGYYDDGGTLNGNLTLAPGQVLLVDYGATGGALGGVNGTITANGAALLYNIGSDTSITATPTTSGFGSVGYQLSNNATVTLPGGTGLTTTLTLAGTGAAVLNGTIATSDQPALQSIAPFTPIDANTQTALAVTNNGTITTTTDNPYILGSTAVSLGTSDTLINNGTIALIDVAGFTDSVAAAVTGGGSVTNAGTILGSGVSGIQVGPGYYRFSGSNVLTNSGTIASDQYAVLISGSAAISNSGTIISTGTGTAAIGSSSYYFGQTTTGITISNLAGGTITGVGDAIDLAGGIVGNAGTINGNVNLAYSPYGTVFYSSGAYLNAGGTLHGNLTLTAGEALSTPLGSYTGTGFSGITGTVDANGATLVYTVAANASTTVAPVAGFTAVAYNLANDATLTLTADSLPTSPLNLSGTGTVDVAAAIMTIDTPAIASVTPLTASGTPPLNALAIANSGALTTTLDQDAYYYQFSSSYPLATVALTNGDTLVNSGTISLANTSGISFSSAGAVIGGGALVNSGMIMATGANAVSLGAAGSTSGTTLSLTNSGSITSDQVAVVTHGAAAIVNSGAIVSTGGSAILAQSAGAIQLTNLAGGTIAGSGDAIASPGGLIANAGAIFGNVDLGYTPVNGTANATTAVYIANGGTLSGSLRFSTATGGNELAETGAGFGVSGTISGGAGTNYVGHLRTASATVALGAALPAGFSTEFTVASGVGTQVTLTGPASNAANIYVGGDGAIVNQANSSGIVTGLAASGESYYANQQTTLSAFTNDAVIGGVELSTSAFTNSGTIAGNIVISAAKYTVVDAAGGSIAGNITIVPDAPAASASGRISLAGNFAGNIAGGTGATTSLVTSGGSAAQPIAFGTIADIASYDQTGGYATLTGTASLGTATIDSGTFVGLVGSTLNAAQVNIAAGASFTSGGTIDGNLAVSGILHVGASPDRLTVNGNVAIAPGSTTVFEVSPTTSSKLVVSGMATIGNNTTLQIVQLQPIAPGTAIDLIDAAGGISGSFTTLSGINGALVERGNQLLLLALFNGSQAANSQVANGVTYLNALIASGNAPPALLAALPALQTANGSPATGAFARLTPEAYATATQIGVENALILSRAARDIGWDNALHSGSLFTFGEALGNWRAFGGDGARGVSHADLSGYGFIGGIGVGSKTASIAAFGGYLDQNEDITGLAASTHAKGFVGGITGHLAGGPAHVDISVIYDDAHAATQRLSSDNIALSSHYRLHSWTADAEASASFGLGDGWSARPHLGATWVWTRRSGAVEDNASIFALTIAGARHGAGFVDGGLRLESRQDRVGQLAGFLDLGGRYQVQGRATDAVAGLGGGPLALLGHGVSRRPVGATVESGATYRATEAVSLFVTGSGELSRGDSSSSITGGIRVRF